MEIDRWESLDEARGEDMVPPFPVPRRDGTDGGEGRVVNSRVLRRWLCCHAVHQHEIRGSRKAWVTRRTCLLPSSGLPDVHGYTPVAFVVYFLYFREAKLLRF